jgi:ubiquinone/menaquinone biosynthesis C-methylase UbiE
LQREEQSSRHFVLQLILDVRPTIAVKTSREKEVRELYEESADWYAELMDAEIDLPVYSDTLGRLAERIVDVSGSVIDTSCGPGHMLSRYHERHDPKRSLLGIDLSPRMVAIANGRLGSSATILTGDMRELGAVESDFSAAVLSFFAIHHIGPEEIVTALREWHRVLRTGGQIVLSAWEGHGPIDYGDVSDVVALRYRKEEIATWVGTAGFVVDRCLVEPVEGMSMKAVYLEGTKQ